MPLVARYGMTKAVRFLPLAFVIVLPIATVLIQKAGPLPASVMDFVAWVATPTGTLVAAGAALAVIVVLCALCLLYTSRCV